MISKKEYDEAVKDLRDTYYIEECAVLIGWNIVLEVTHSAVADIIDGCLDLTPDAMLEEMKSYREFYTDLIINAIRKAVDSGLSDELLSKQCYEIAENFFKSRFSEMEKEN